MLVYSFVILLILLKSACHNTVLLILCEWLNCITLEC